MRKVIVGIGIPGSGKTTVLRSFAEKNGYAYICPDDIRFELTGNVADQSKNKEAYQEAYKRLVQHIQNGTVVFDATMANPEQRKQFLDFARKNGAEKIDGVFIDATLERADARNRARERKVPTDVMERMNAWLRDSPPEIADGFDGLFTLDEEHKLIHAKIKGEHEIHYKEFGTPR